jgi:hypothetical protein
MNEITNPTVGFKKFTHLQEKGIIITFKVFWGGQGAGVNLFYFLPFIFFFFFSISFHFI